MTVNEELIERAVSQELARTVDDVLARRSRLLFVDAQAAKSTAPQVAEIMSRLLSRPSEWANAQVEEFEKIAAGYFVETI